MPPDFLSGYNQQRQLNQQADAGQLQHIQGGLSIASELRKQEEGARIRQIIQSGGSPEQVIQALVSIGPTGAAVAQQYAGAMKTAQETALRQRMTSGKMDLNNPDQLEELGASGIPGMAHLTARAARLRKEQEDARNLTGMQSQPMPVPVAPTEAAAIAQLRAQGGGTVGFGDNPTTEVPRGGSFQGLMSSNIPAIAQQAADLQRRVDSGRMTAAQADAFHQRLVTQQAAAEAASGRQQAGIEAAQAGRQFTVDNRPPPREAGPRIPLGYRLAADGTSMERIPVLGGDKVSDDALTNDAWYSIINGKTRPGSLPVGRDEGNAYRAQLREKTAEIAKNIGLSPERLASMGPENRAKFGALNAVEKDLAAIRPFDEMLNTNVKVAIDLAKKISRTDSQFLNRPITWLMNNASDNPDIAEYLFQIQTVKTEGARILNNPRLVGQLTDSARQEMAEVINGNMPLGQTERVLQRMVQDGKNRVKAIEDEANRLRSDIRGSAKMPSENTVEDAVKAAGYAYEPDTYEYRVGIGGQVQRRKK